MSCADWYRGVLAQEWYFTPKGMCPASCDFFKFWEISDNVLVPGKIDMVAMEV